MDKDFYYVCIEDHLQFFLYTLEIKFYFKVNFCQYRKDLEFRYIC